MVAATGEGRTGVAVGAGVVWPGVAVAAVVAGAVDAVRFRDRPATTWPVSATPASTTKMRTAASQRRLGDHQRRARTSGLVPAPVSGPGGAPVPGLALAPGPGGAPVPGPALVSGPGGAPVPVPGVGGARSARRSSVG